MIKVKEYMSTLTTQLKTAFREHLLYIGLQGSYMRGEATENSDIDVVVVLDKLHEVLTQRSSHRGKRLER